MTYEEFMRHRPCWIHDPDKLRMLKELRYVREDWTPIDILELYPNKIDSALDLCWALSVVGGCEFTQKLCEKLNPNIDADFAVDYFGAVSIRADLNNSFALLECVRLFIMRHNIKFASDLRDALRGIIGDIT